MRLTGLMAVLVSVAPWMAAAENSAPMPMRVQQAAHALFPDMPDVVEVAQIDGQCGADRAVNPVAAYCTSRNSILLRAGAEDSPALAHLVAHLYGHAVQVRHGIADIALREIRARPAEEAKLRGWVTRQVECIAGVIVAEAGLTLDLNDLHSVEPLTGSHWGRNPLSAGPKVSIGLEPRAEWFEIGQTDGLVACAPGEFTAELLIKARR